MVVPCAAVTSFPPLFSQCLSIFAARFLRAAAARAFKFGVGESRLRLLNLLMTSATAALRATAAVLVSHSPKAPGGETKINVRLADRAQGAGGARQFCGKSPARRSSRYAVTLSQQPQRRVGPRSTGLRLDNRRVARRHGLGCVR